MFREMRRKDREANSEVIIRVLEEGEYGFLGTICDNGYPSVIPLNYVYMDNSIYFHCAKEGQKLDNIKVNDRVCFTIVGKTKVLPQEFSTNYESVIVYGRAMMLDGEEKKKALKALINKYSKGYEKEGYEYIERAFDTTCVVKINIEKATGKHRKG